MEKSETADISLNESVSVVLQNNYEPKSDIVIDGDLSVSKAEAQNIKNALNAMEILFWEPQQEVQMSEKSFLDVPIIRNVNIYRI